MPGAPGGLGAAGGDTAAGGAGGAGCGGGGAAGAAGCGAGAAAGGVGGAACGGGGGGGAAGRGATGGGGGAGRGGAAAGGGAGRAGAGAAFGGCLGGCLGFPSGPSSSLACATTIGVVCACDGMLPNCIAVRAVVASSNKRSFVMMVWIPGKRSGDKGLATRSVIKLWRSTNKRWAGLWRASKAGLYLFPKTRSPGAPLFITHSGDHLKPCFHIVPCGISAWSGPRSDAAPGIPAPPVSAAAEGVVGGPCGPRTGNSSGVRPGNSSGLGGSPGSCIGGGTSGRGFPGGLSCGGSTGRPGLIGGSSCGSIGMSRVPEFEGPNPTAPMRQCSASPALKRAPAGCCCGSCRFRCSRVRACLRCSHRAIRCATDVRSPPRAAKATAALP